jgi:hypothetical protein
MLFLFSLLNKLLMSMTSTKSTNTLQTAAPPNVIDIMARANPSDLINGCEDESRKQATRNSLLAMKAVIEANLSRMDVDEEESVPALTPDNVGAQIDGAYDDEPKIKVDESYDDDMLL